MTSPRCLPAAFAFGTLSSTIRNVSRYPVPCSCQYTECMTGTAYCACGVSNGRELAPTCATNLLSALQLLHLSAMKLLQQASDFCANTLELCKYVGSLQTPTPPQSQTPHRHPTLRPGYLSVRSYNKDSTSCLETDEPQLREAKAQR